MSALAQRAGTKNQLINYDFGQKTREEPAPGVHIHFKSGQVKSGQVKSGQVKSGQVNWGQVKLGHSWSS